MAEILSSYLFLLGIFSIVIGSLVSLLFFLFSAYFFVSEEIKKVFKNLSASIFFLFLYFFSNILFLFYSALRENLAIIILQNLFAIFSLFFLIYSSITIYILALELGFASPKNKKKIRKILEKQNSF